MAKTGYYVSRIPVLSTAHIQPGRHTATATVRTKRHGNGHCRRLPGRRLSLPARHLRHAPDLQVLRRHYRWIRFDADGDLIDALPTWPLVAPFTSQPDFYRSIPMIGEYH